MKLIKLDKPCLKNRKDKPSGEWRRIFYNKNQISFEKISKSRKMMPKDL